MASTTPLSTQSSSATQSLPDADAKIAIALNRRVHQSTPVIAISIGLLYLFHVFVDMLLPSQRPLYPQYLMVAAILIAYGLALPRWRMPHSWAHPLTALVVLMILGNTLLAMYRVQNPLETTTVLILMVGVGCVFLSLRWLLAMLCAMVAGWAIVATQVLTALHWRHFTFSIVTAFAVSIMLHWVRYRTVRRIELMRMESERKNRQLASSLAELEREVTERKRAERELELARDELEERVEQRTFELADANAALQDEIAERKLAAEQASHLQSQLEHLNRVSSMGEMASALSHEINQPLAIITNYARACVRGKDAGTLDDDDVRRSLTSIGDQAMRCGDIVQRIKAYMSKSPPQRTRIDINAVVDEICQLLHPEAKKENVVMEMRLAEGLPPISADRVQIQQIMVNLVRNAFDAMEETEPESRRLTIETVLDDGNVRVSVTDAGEGIPADVGDEIFAPYFSTKSSGLGMGLSISRRIVEAHGGRLWAACPAEGGTKFHFTLPIHAKEVVCV